MCWTWHFHSWECIFPSVFIKSCFSLGLYLFIYLCPTQGHEWLGHAHGALLGLSYTDGPPLCVPGLLVSRWIGTANWRKGSQGKQAGLCHWCPFKYLYVMGQQVSTLCLWIKWRACNTCWCPSPPLVWFGDLTWWWCPSLSPQSSPGVPSVQTRLRTAVCQGKGLS